MTNEEENGIVEEQSDGSAETDQDENEGLSPREKAKQETERNRPDVGYYLIKRDMFKEPWRQETALKFKHSLKLSEMSVPADSNIVKHHVRDEELNKYDNELRAETGESITELIENLKSALSEDDEKEIRLRLAQLAQVAENNPRSCVDAVDSIIIAVREGSQPVQAESLGILTEIAEIEPEILSEAIAPIINLLEQDTHPKLTAQNIKFLNVLSPSFPEETSQAVPALASNLHEGNSSDELIAKALLVAAKQKPTALTNVVTELGDYIEADEKPKSAQKQLLAALGRTAKEHPDPVSGIVPQLVGLLDSQDLEVRVNVAGVLADVADTHPTVIKPAIPRATDLLAGDDTKGRHNATSIMARVAKADPDAVQPALSNLIELLEADDVGTRINACLAVKYMNAESALPVLKQQKINDPDEEVRQAAKQAIEAISGPE